MKLLLIFCTFAISLALQQVAIAQPVVAAARSSAVTSALLAQRVEVVEGKTVLKPAGQAKLGDLIEYSNTYRNGGTGAAEKLLATVPVPVGTTLVVGSLNPSKAQASTDGVQFAPIPLMRSMRQSDGTERKVPVPLSNYRAVRWDIGVLPPESAVTVSLQVRIDVEAIKQASSVRP